METYIGRIKVYLAVNHHSIMMHHITKGTFISNRLMRYAFSIAVILCRDINNIVLVSKYHILPGNEADKQ
ncbi:hypothetical protein JN11_02941 [Mucilaginibacter frigoritolerans]|uniref:Uncharacterized protein n=1 Tax=Mucilaginibacter frigoritolerans TaxID=652788 RepID=A0A562TZ47_9SPHI|nr:hypothetical protein JN11_02941 [Mucilaginibacter frigoritolerans]